MLDTATAYHRPRLLLLFVDGVGLAPESPDNPLATTPTPALERLLGGPLVAERLGGAVPGVVLAALDANLGVAGLPQSATGQTALFTGVNASAAVGRHVSAFPGPRLRRLLREHGLLVRLLEAGHATTFANAYSAAYRRRLEAGARRRSVTTCLVQFAGLPFRDEEDLAAGRAVSWDITRDLWAERTGVAVPGVTAEEAGRHLAGVAAGHRFTLFETFLTDLAGHRRWGLEAATAVARLDGLLSGVLAAAPPELTVLMTSDHGNLEVASERLHTRNPVPLLAAGPAAARFAGLRSILEVAPAVVACLGGEKGV